MEREARPYMWGPKNRAVPVAHEQVLRVLKAVAARLCAEALFALFKLLEQAEVARDLCSHGCRLYVTGCLPCPVSCLLRCVSTVICYG